jgi:hypothetical protein
MSLTSQLRVVEVRRDAEDVTTVTVAGRNLDDLGAQAGQFFNWRFLGRSGVDACQPVLAVRGPDEHHVAVHRQASR